MEENRLKPMPENYDHKLFDDIYAKTEKLRKKLAWQIDPRRFGVDYKEILSWFDVKFLQVFTKYQDNKEPELLKAHIIQALMMFKQRILRFSYSNKAQLHNTVDIDETSNLPSDFEPRVDDQKTLLNLSLSYLKCNLSNDACKVLMVELNPPLYILSCLSANNKASTTKIPSHLIAEYLGWNDNNKLKKVSACRQEIKIKVAEAREFFHDKDQMI